MNSSSRTVRLMPFTARTSPNFLTISLVNTAAMLLPVLLFLTCDARSGVSPGRSVVHIAAPHRQSTCRHAPRPARARSERRRSGLARPLLEDDLALLRGQLHRVFG